MKNTLKKLNDEEIRRELSYILSNSNRFDENGRFVIMSRAKHKEAERIYQDWVSKYGENRVRKYLSFESDSLIDWNKPQTEATTALSIFDDSVNVFDCNTFMHKEEKYVWDIQKPHSKHKKQKHNKRKKHGYKLSKASPKKYKKLEKNRSQLNDVKNEILNEKNERIESILPHILETEIPVKVSGTEILFYDDDFGYWKIISDAEVETKLLELLKNDERLKVNHREIREARKLLMALPQLQDEFSEENTYLVNCENGVLDIKSGELLKHRMRYKFTRVINANYDPNANGDVFKLFINDACSGDEELIMLVQEALGYAFSFSSKIKSAVMFYGPHDTGKSCILKLITDICGKDNVSNVSIQDYSDPKYAARMRDKALNIAPDLPSRPLDEISGFKSAVSGIDSIETRKLYENPVSTPCKAKHYFGANQFIKLIRLDEQNLEAFLAGS